MAPAINLHTGIYVDKAALNAAITSANGKSEAAYTPNSWSPFATSRTAATGVRDNAYATQAQVDAAAADLNTKMAALTARANKSALQAAITRANGYSNADGRYTSASWSAMQSALGSANTVNGNLNATQAQVNTATTNLNNAISGLAKATFTATIPFSTLAATARRACKQWWTDGSLSQRNLDVLYGYFSVGKSAGGVDIQYEGYKTYFDVSFPNVGVITKCTVNCYRKNDYPDPAGSPAARMGTGVVERNVNQYDNTYVTGNVGVFSTSVRPGAFAFDYTSQANALRGQSVTLIMELVDSGNVNASGGYALSDMSFYIEYQK